MPQDIKCDNCQKQELTQLKNELHLCRKSSESKDRKIKALDKKVFVLTIIAVGIAAIFGKEALDVVIEWIDSIGKFNSGVNNISATGNVPHPGTLAVFGAFAIMTRKSRKRK